ncbi:kinesin light chain [Pyrenochaeta sp. DS3sAY3a]|nr:kinesin light chain [Pyrenochaeta sp. DS3sAY3a]
MRLLHLEQSGRLVSTDFHGKPIPPYAILSHRWGNSEILFEDLGSEAYKKKENGYAKVAFCAKQAAQDQLQYFWIDTCCIDKWNSRERSRAINSMFRWYSNATRCYVFLSDVSVSTATDTVQRSDWEASFRASDWFTRGWTLQELIAPASVEFFTCEGQRLGDKTLLEQLVHEITNIPLAALRNPSLDQFTQRERMHWADNRKTTEEEDLVYCLLGILGKDKALRRLQMEVETANSTPSIIPFSRNEHFVGRESQLASLEANLFSDKHNTTRLAIVGPGGTGKSQVALELAYRTREKDKTCSVFWSFAGIAQRLKIPGWDDEKADVIQLVKLRLEEESARDCLLVFDNADDINLGSSRLSAAPAVGLVECLPQSSRCSVVFTTTESDLAKRLALHALVKLHELTPDAAERMLENFLNRPVSSSEQQEAKLLLQELSYLPLAIVQAAACINATAVTLQQYRSQLDARNDHNLENPVATTLLISLGEIRRVSVLAADYLFLAACVAQRDIPFVLFEAKSPEESVDAISVLSRYALVTKRPEDSALDVHRLVHCALREWLQQQDLLSQNTKVAIKQLRRVFPDHSHHNRSRWRRLIPHTKYVLSYRSAEAESYDGIMLAWRYAHALHSDGRYDEAEKMFVHIMETFKRTHGEEHPNTLSSMAIVASTYRNQGRFKAAEELETQVMESSKKVLGEEHQDTLSSMSNLASSYGKQGRWKEAEKISVQVLETRKRVLGEEHQDTLSIMSNLATSYAKQGRWKEAEEISVQVLETGKRVLGEEHPDMLTSMFNLAWTYKSQKRHKDALSLMEICFQLRKRTLGEEHPKTVRSGNTVKKWRAQRR